MKETLGKEFYESADKVVTISRPETFEDYLQRLKDRRTEDNYKYTDDDFKNYIHYIFNCYETNLSVYKCLEFMYFAERDIDDTLFNREPREERRYSEEEVNSIFYAICKHSFFEDNVETVYLQDVKDEFEQCKHKQEQHDFLPGFINQFDPKEGEINGEEWTAVQFIKWLELNKFKIVK